MNGKVDRLTCEGTQVHFTHMRGLRRQNGGNLLVSLGRSKDLGRWTSNDLDRLGLLRLRRIEETLHHGSREPGSKSKNCSNARKVAPIVGFWLHSGLLPCKSLVGGFERAPSLATATRSSKNLRVELLSIVALIRPVGCVAHLLSRHLVFCFLFSLFFFFLSSVCFVFCHFCCPDGAAFCSQRWPCGLRQVAD